MGKYYKYKGSLQECEIKEIIIRIISKSIRSKNRVILGDEFSKILSNDEFIKIELSIKDTIKENIFANMANKFILIDIAAIAYFPLFKLPLIIPIINVNINIVDITLTKNI